MRVLVFGASTTQGLWDSQGGWVQRLRGHYETKQKEDFSKEQPLVFNLGVIGDTTRKLINRFESETKARWPLSNELALVFSIGTNNSAMETGRETSSPEIYRNELIELIEKGRRLTDKIMFVGLTPCQEDKTNPVAWNPDYSFSNSRIKLFEDVMREFCREQNIPHATVYETFEEKIGMGIKLFQDGLHPNDLGHQLIYEIVQPQLDKVLEHSD